MFLGLVVAFFVSCIDSKGDSKSIKTNESNSELFIAQKLNDTGDANQIQKTVKEMIQSAPDTLWLMARDKQDRYFGSVFFEPDGSVWVSYESSVARMELLHVEWTEELIRVYYSLQSLGNEIEQKVGPLQYFLIEISIDLIQNELPSNGGDFDLTVIPVMVRQEDIPKE